MFRLGFGEDCFGSFDGGGGGFLDVDDFGLQGAVVFVGVVILEVCQVLDGLLFMVHPLFILIGRL